MSDRQDQFEQLSAYLDGELDAESARRLEEALAADEELRQELAGLRDTRQLLQQVALQPAPAHFARDVLRKAERHHHLGRGLPGGVFRSVRWIPLAAAAVVLLACGFAMVIIANLSDPDAASVDELAAAEPLASRRGAPDADLMTSDDRAAGVEVMVSDAETEAEEVVTEVIFTDNMELAHHQVREAFLRNDLQPVLSEGLPPVEIPNRAVNVYNMQVYQPDTIRLEVDVLLDQAPQLRADLARVRGVQTVSQHAATAPEVAIAADADEVDDDPTDWPDDGDVARRDEGLADDAAPADAGPPLAEAASQPGEDMASARQLPQLQRVIVILNAVPDPTAAAAVESARESPLHPPADQE